MPDTFEDRLARTPRTQLDPAWRAEILGAAIAAAGRGPQRPANWRGGWTFAWSALAAAWVFILALNKMSEMAPRPTQPSRWIETTTANLQIDLETRWHL